MTKKSNMTKLINRARKVHAKFPRKWDAKTQVVNLMEEMGELANSVLLEHGDKIEKRRRAELKDSFADLFFALIATADAYKVDLEKVLDKALTEIEARQRNRDYHDE